MLNPVKKHQFILLLSTTCFDLKVHHQVEHNNKRIYSRITIILINWDDKPSGYAENIASWILL